MAKALWASWWRVFLTNYQYDDFLSLSSAMEYAKLQYEGGVRGVRVKGQSGATGYWETIWEDGEWKDAENVRGLHEAYSKRSADVGEAG